MVVTSWPIAHRLLSYSPIGQWSYETIRSENGLSYVNKSQEPKARLRLICEVIAIFARTIRNSQRPSIIIIYRRSPNSYRAHTYVAQRREEQRREETRVWVDARTRTHAGRVQSILLHYGVPLARIRASSSWPCLELWLDTLHRSSSILIRGVSGARVHKRFASSHLRQSRWRYRLVSARGLSASKIEGYERRRDEMRVDRSTDRSIDRSIDWPLFDRALNEALLHLWIRARNASRDAPRIH